MPDKGTVPPVGEWWVFRKPTGQFDARSRDLFVTTVGMVTRVTPDFFEVEDGDEDPAELWFSEGWEPVARVTDGGLV